MNQTFINVSKKLTEIAQEHKNLCNKILELGTLIESGEYKRFIKTCHEVRQACEKYGKQALEYIHQVHAIEKKQVHVVQDSIELCKKYSKSCEDCIYKCTEALQRECLELVRTAVQMSDKVTASIEQVFAPHSH